MNCSDSCSVSASPSPPAKIALYCTKIRMDLNEIMQQSYIHIYEGHGWLCGFGLICCLHSGDI